MTVADTVYCNILEKSSKILQKYLFSYKSIKNILFAMEDEKGVREMELKSVSIDSAERIFLDGEELQNVTAYKLEHSADSEGPAELTVTMYVNVGQVCSESSKWNLSADKIVEAVCKRLKEELQAADQSISQDDVKTYRGIADQKEPGRKG